MSAEKSTSQNAPESTIADTGMSEVPLKTWSETKAESFSTELAGSGRSPQSFLTFRLKSIVGTRIGRYDLKRPISQSAGHDIECGNSANKQSIREL